MSQHVVVVALLLLALGQHLGVGCRLPCEEESAVAASLAAAVEAAAAAAALVLLEQQWRGRARV